MREDYYDFIKRNEIQDTLSWVEDMSFSKKLNVLEEIMTVYSRDVLNRALNKYEEMYVKTHRVIPYMTRNALVSLCKTIQIEDSKKK